MKIENRVIEVTERGLRIQIRLPESGLIKKTMVADIDPGTGQCFQRQKFPEDITVQYLSH